MCKKRLFFTLLFYGHRRVGILDIFTSEVIPENGSQIRKTKLSLQIIFKNVGSRNLPALKNLLNLRITITTVIPLSPLLMPIYKKKKFASSQHR